MAQPSSSKRTSHSKRFSIPEPLASTSPTGNEDISTLFQSPVSDSSRAKTSPTSESPKPKYPTEAPGRKRSTPRPSTSHEPGLEEARERRKSSTKSSDGKPKSKEPSSKDLARTKIGTEVMLYDRRRNEAIENRIITITRFLLLVFTIPVAIAAFIVTYRRLEGYIEEVLILTVAHVAAVLWRSVYKITLEKVTGYKGWDRDSWWVERSSFFVGVLATFAGLSFEQWTRESTEQTYVEFR